MTQNQQFDKRLNLNFKHCDPNSIFMCDPNSPDTSPHRDSDTDYNFYDARLTLLASEISCLIN